MDMFLFSLCYIPTSGATGLDSILMSFFVSLKDLKNTVISSAKDPFILQWMCETLDSTES